MATGLFPASGFVPLLEDPVDNLHHIILPAVILGTGLSAVIMRQTRSSMLESLSTDYVRTARAKGLRRGAVVRRHALRNSLIVVVTIVGLQLGGLISGAVVTEQIFGLPGFGKMTIDAVFQRDYPVIQGVVLITATAYIVINFLVDLLYSLDRPTHPRGRGGSMTADADPRPATDPGTAARRGGSPACIRRLRRNPLAVAQLRRPAGRHAASPCSRPWLAPYAAGADRLRQHVRPAGHRRDTCSAPTTSAVTCCPGSCSACGRRSRSALLAVATALLDRGAARPGGRLLPARRTR